ncbi:MAG TPA: YsnF/AvaK domain-containing protein, partial [Nitrososphaeraceae archaeon]|nr:YsnF/AvaK domain-containing protein [Nitrososphaeraceae archaeon]
GAIGIDGLDLGEVSEVGDTYVITQKGLLNKKRYHIPISSAESFDGDILKMRVNEVELHGYEEGGGQKFEGYSSFKSSDLSKELETKIPVMGESLDVSKRLTEDNVDIIKEPVKETKTVEIELTREMVTIERRPVNDDSSSYKSTIQSSDQSSPLEGPVDFRTEISIPLKREEPVVTKTPYVKEEVIVRKRPITETKTITEEITTENINYNNMANKKSEERNNIKDVESS